VDISLAPSLLLWTLPVTTLCHSHEKPEQARFGSFWGHYVFSERIRLRQKEGVTRISESKRSRFSSHLRRLSRRRSESPSSSYRVRTFFGFSILSFVDRSFMSLRGAAHAHTHTQTCQTPVSLCPHNPPQPTPLTISTTRARISSPYIDLRTTSTVPKIA
jgi:hypothetical protein